MPILFLTLSLILFASCTFPGFLHVTGLRKNKKISNICIALGILFAIQLVVLLVDYLTKCNKRERRVCNKCVAKYGKCDCAQ